MAARHRNAKALPRVAKKLSQLLLRKGLVFFSDQGRFLASANSGASAPGTEHDSAPVTNFPSEAVVIREKLVAPSGMTSSIPISPGPETRFSENVWAGATPAVFSPRASGEKWGRSSPLRCFALVQNQRPRETQPQCSVKLPFTEKVNGTVNRSVNRVFHAPFTFPRQKRPLQTFRPH